MVERKYPIEWTCRVCGQRFKCWDITDGQVCTSDAFDSGKCHCYDHTLMESMEEKRRKCRVVPIDYVAKPRKGRLIGEFPQNG